MSQIKGTNVIAPVVPLDTADQHPSHEARYGKGGYRTVATTVERDAIPAPRREAGMLVYVEADGKAYKLLENLTSWEEFKSGASTWGELAGKPSTFPPSSHAASHGQAGGDPITIVSAQVSDFASAVVAAAPPTTNASLLVSGTLPDARLSSNIARTSDVSSAVAAVVNAAPAALDTLNELAAALGNDASFATTVTNALAGKAAAVHTHVIADVSGLQTALDGKQAAGSYAAAVHTHGISDVTGLQTALDGKAASSHTHTASAISDFASAAVSAVTWTTLTGKPTFATVATSGSAADLTGTLSASRLPSTTVTPGSYGSASAVATYTVDATGRLTAAGSTAIAIAAGAVSGLASVATSGSASDLGAGTVPVARLPLATTGAAGAIIVGSGLNVSSGTLSAAVTSVNGQTGAVTVASYTLPAATTTTLGGIIVGSGLAVSSGTVSVVTYAVRSDTVGSTSYIGRAVSGSATSASVWTIRKTVLTSAGAVSATTTATNVKWDDRLTATYS